MAIFNSYVAVYQAGYGGSWESAVLKTGLSGNDASRTVILRPNMAIAAGKKGHDFDEP